MGGYSQYKYEGVGWPKRGNRKFLTLRGIEFPVLEIFKGGGGDCQISYGPKISRHRKVNQTALMLIITMFW